MIRYFVVTLISLGFASQALAAAPVILNEYNAVGSTKWLDEGEEGDADPFGASTRADVTLGRIVGNGGNWFELAVVGDGTQGSSVDMTGWTLSWNEDNTDMGTLVLSSDAFWQSVPAGSLITFAQNQDIIGQSGATVVSGSDTGLDFGTGDNWAHVYTADAALIDSSTTNVDDDLDSNGNPVFGAFSVGNDDWQLTILDAASTVIQGPIGEGIEGGSVNSREVYKFEADITVMDDTLYNDGKSSTFGAGNIWTDDMDISQTQDFSSFGVVPEPNAATLLLPLVGLLALRRRK